MTTNKKRPRWKKEPREIGLASIGALPRGSYLHDGEKKYAHTYPLGGGWRCDVKGWYFVCQSDAVGEYINTCNNPAPDEETAKAQAMEYVKARLNQP